MCIREFFLHLASNHDVNVEGEHEDRLIYSAASPDESALVYAAKVPPMTTIMTSRGAVTGLGLVSDSLPYVLYVMVWSLVPCLFVGSILVSSLLSESQAK